VVDLEEKQPSFEPGRAIDVSQLGEGQVIIFVGAALREILLLFRSPAKTKTERTFRRDGA
jgi:hypothetical protein